MIHKAIQMIFKTLFRRLASMLVIAALAAVVIPAVSQAGDPTLRTFLIDRAGPGGVNARVLASRLDEEKVVSAKDLKKYVEAAIKSDPKNFLAWHVLGRWHYEVSNLNMVERAAVKLFYGGFPPASLKESIAAFEKSKSLTTGFIQNYLELAKAYHRNNQNDKAIDLLKQMMLVPNRTEDDPALKEAGKKLLKDWE